jgi:hypothetical protein
VNAAVRFTPEAVLTLSLSRSVRYQNSPVKGDVGSAESIRSPVAAADGGNTPDTVNATPWPTPGVDETVGAVPSRGNAVEFAGGGVGTPSSAERGSPSPTAIGTSYTSRTLTRARNEPDFSGLSTDGCSS